MSAQTKSLQRTAARAGASIRRARAAERAEAVAAIDLMHRIPSYGLDDPDVVARRLGMRPLRPPPVRLEPVQVPASVLALQADRRLGLVE
jgi:hypothetical protein